MYIKYFQIADRTIEFNKGLNVMVHTPGTCQISNKFLKVLETLWNRSGRTKNSAEINGLLVTFDKRITNTRVSSVWRVRQTKVRHQVLLNDKPHDRSQLQSDLTDEGMLYYYRGKPMNLLTVGAFEKMPDVESSETWSMICEAFLHLQLTEQFDLQLDTSRRLCNIMMHAKNHEQEMARLKETMKQHKSTTDAYRALEKRVCALQTVVFKKTVRKLQARQARFQQSLDQDVAVLTPVLDEIEATEEHRDSVKLAAEQQSIAMQNLWHYLQAEINVLEIELDELKSARALTAQHKDRRAKFMDELNTIKTVYMPLEDKVYDKMNDMTEKQYAAKSEAYCKRNLKMAVVMAQINDMAGRQEQLTQMHHKVRQLTRRQAEQESGVSDLKDDLRNQERRFAILDRNLVEDVESKSEVFAGLIELKRRMFELQKDYSQNQLIIAKLSVQLPALSAEIDEQTKAFEKCWRVESDTITALNYVESFIQSLPETEQVRLEYMGPLFRQMSMDDEPEEFGMAYEVVKECLVACLFRTHDTMLRASGMFRQHMTGLYGRSDMFVYTFMALESPYDDTNDITMVRQFIPFAELLSDDCELRGLLQFRRLVLVEHSVLETADAEFIAELDEAGYCVMSLDGPTGVDRIVRENGFLCAPAVDGELTFSRFKAELGDILDKKRLLGAQLVERTTNVEREQQLCLDISELRQEIDRLREAIPRLKYNIHQHMMELMRIRKHSRDAVHALKILGIDLRIHRDVLVDRRQIEYNDSTVAELGREIDNKEDEAAHWTQEIAKYKDLEQYSTEIRPHLDEILVLQNCLNYDLLLDEHVDVDVERLDAMIAVCEEQLVYLSVNMESAVREMRRCEDKLHDDVDESEALTVRARLKTAKGFAQYPNRVDRAELFDLKDQLREFQANLAKASKKRGSDVDINSNDLNEVVSAAAAAKRELNGMTPPVSDASYKKIINNLNVIEKVEQSTAIDANALGHELSPFFEKMTLKNIHVVLQMMDAALKLVTGLDFHCLFEANHTVGRSLRVGDIEAIAIIPPVEELDVDNVLELVDEKFYKMVFFVCLMVVNKMKFIFVENMDKIVAPELMQKTLLFLKSFEVTTQIIVTMQAGRVGKHVKKLAPSCECFKMGGKEPRTKPKTGRLQKRRND